MFSHGSFDKIRVTDEATRAQALAKRRGLPLKEKPLACFFGNLVKNPGKRSSTMPA
jgi:hypothetical protein